MRELPYMRAANSLEKNQNIEKIFQRVELYKRQKIAFASKPVFRGPNYQDQFISNKTTQAYEGESEYSSQHAGRATFKVKKD